MKISEHIFNTPVRKAFIGSGEAATSNTLNIMKDIINRSAGNYYIRRWAEVMIKDAECPLEQIQQIYYYISNHTKYSMDPVDFEMIRTPQVSLNLIEAGDVPQLDCDDLTVLSLSLLKSLGFHVAIRAIGFNSELTHVYGLVAIPKSNSGCSGGTWKPFDLVHPDGFGVEKPGASRIITMGV